MKDAHLDRHLDEFEKFKESFEKIYETIEEELERFQRFRDSMYKVDKAREIEDDTEFGITIFSDLSDEEFQDVSFYFVLFVFSERHASFYSDF